MLGTILFEILFCAIITAVVFAIVKRAMKATTVVKEDFLAMVKEDQQDHTLRLPDHQTEKSEATR